MSLEITNLSINDGFGAQYHNLIMTLYYADENDIDFVYTPFEDMEHNYEQDPYFLEKKELLINFRGNFNTDYSGRARKNYSKYGVSQVLSTFKNFVEEDIDKFANSKTIETVKTLFKTGKKSRFVESNGTVVAIHIRRPNPHDSRIDGADTPDNVYLELIKKLESDNTHFHIYSQKGLDKEKYKGNVVFHIDTPIEETFTDFVFSDVLVLSRSTFSYVAGLLHEGPVYYLPFWHKAPSKWNKFPI
jgi:hypothetical protein